MSVVSNLMDWFHNLFEPVIDSGTPIVHVTNVLPVSDHTLVLAFDNGDLGTIDLARHVEFRGVLAPLQDVTFFRRVSVENGTLSWPGDIQMDPTVLHQLVMNNPSGGFRPRPTPPLRPTGSPQRRHRQAQAPQRTRSQRPREKDPQRN